MTRETVDNQESVTMDVGSAEQTVVHFPQGLPGFEELTRFFLCERDGLWPLTLLVAVDTADVALPLLRSGEFLTDYLPSIPASDLRALDAKGAEDLDLFVVVTFDRDSGSISANLMAPICMNRARRLGRQVVLADGAYPLQYSLLPVCE